MNLKISMDSDQGNWGVKINGIYPGWKGRNNSVPIYKLFSFYIEKEFTKNYLK